MILDWKRRLAFWSGAICVGLVAILFAVASEQANDLFHKLIAISPYLPLLITPLGLILIVVTTRRFFPGSEGSGTPQTIASLDPKENQGIRDRVLSLRVATGKIILTIMGLFFGASAGREGPTVQIGASIMHRLGNLARFPRAIIFLLVFWEQRREILHGPLSWPCRRGDVSTKHRVSDQKERGRRPARVQAPGLWIPARETRRARQ